MSNRKRKLDLKTYRKDFEFECQIGNEHYFQGQIGNFLNIKMKHLQHMCENTWNICIYMQHPDLFLQHTSETLATYVWNRWNIWNIHLKHMCIAIATCIIFRSTLLQKRWFVPVGKPLLSRFPNRERQSGTKGGALLSQVWQPGQKVPFFSCFSFLNSFSISIILLHYN